MVMHYVRLVDYRHVGAPWETLML